MAANNQKDEARPQKTIVLMQFMCWAQITICAISANVVIKQTNHSLYTAMVYEMRLQLIARDAPMPFTCFEVYVTA